MLLLATKKQGKSTLRRRFQSIGPVVELLPPPLLSPIPWARHLYSADASVVVIEVFVLISCADAFVVVVDSLGMSSIPRRLHRHLQSLGIVVYSLSSADASVIVAESLDPSSSTDAIVVVVNSMGL